MIRLFRRLKWEVQGWIELYRLLRDATKPEDGCGRDGCCPQHPHGHRHFRR